MTTSTPNTALAALGRQLAGRLILPGDAGYDQARALFYGGMDRHPVAVARVANVADVQAVVNTAREAGLPLAVRSGGHSVTGFSVGEGSLVLDLHDMRALDFDVAGRTAWAEAGATAGEYTTAAAAHGLATGFGDTGSVGLGGLITGGGVGYLARYTGLTIDDLLAADVVTADGVLHHVDAAHEPDLFWAIRGGGGNFGVVTRFQLRLHPIDQIYGGMLVLPATPAVIAGFVAAADAAPEALNAIGNLIPGSFMPFLPEEVKTQRVLLAMMVYAGPPADGERAVAPFRALAAPLADMLKPMRYVEIYPPEDDSYHPIAVSRNLLLDRLDEPDAAAILQHLNASTAMMAVTQIRVLGGAMARVPAEATAYAHRQRRLMLNLACLYPDLADTPKHAAWVEAFAAELSRGQNPGAYVNFVGAEGAERMSAIYPPATAARLAALKARYDPTNLFRFNHNIAPAAQ